MNLNKLFPIILFACLISIVLFNIEDAKIQKGESFNVIDYCQEYDNAGLHCPYRVKYKHDKTGRRLYQNKNNNATNNDNSGNNVNNCNATKKRVVEPKPLTFNNLEEGKHYRMAFDKYPVYLGNNYNHAYGDKCHLQKI